ncbi:MAG TPA: DUF4439 domain-containing protein [Kribbellaceae bacterium]
MTLDQTAALQAALAGEHAALYAVGVAGGHLHGSRFAAAEQLYAAHRDRRDALTALIAATGTTPVAAEPAYDLPAAVTTPAGAAALVRVVEQRLAAVYGDLVEAATDARVRGVAVHALVTVARDQTTWGATPVAFPGANP